MTPFPPDLPESAWALARAPWVIAAAAVIAVMVVSAWLVNVSSRRIDDADRRHGARQLDRFATFIAVAVILFVAIGPNWPSFGVFLGVAGAGVAFALQEVIASLAG